MDSHWITRPAAAMYLAGMVTGTALLMAAMSGETDRDFPPGATRAEQVMQAATEQALVAEPTVLLAYDAKSNAGRGW